MVDIERPIESPRLTQEPQCAAHAEAMFEVLSDPAIFKRSNRRSRRLLEALGFAAPCAEDALRWPVETDEDLRLRHVTATGAGAPP